MSTIEARMAVLTRSLVQLATNQHNLYLEMATIQEMRRDIAPKGPIRAAVETKAGVYDSVGSLLIAVSKEAA